MPPRWCVHTRASPSVEIHGQIPAIVTPPGGWSAAAHSAERRELGDKIRQGELGSRQRGGTINSTTPDARNSWRTTRTTMVDRERTCPLLLRTFVNKGGHRRCARVCASISSPARRRATAARHRSLCRHQARGLRGKGQGAARRRGAGLLVDGRDVAGALRPHQGGQPGSTRPEQPAFVCDCLPRRLPARTWSLPSSLARTRAWRLVLTTAALPRADKRGTMTLKEVGITHALRRGMDDEKTLAMLRSSSAQSAPLGSALARPLCLLRARLVALGRSALPGGGRPAGRPATASGARASACIAADFHRL